jgi:hypothetical protein
LQTPVVLKRFVGFEIITSPEAEMKISVIAGVADRACGAGSVTANSYYHKTQADANSTYQQED